MVYQGQTTHVWPTSQYEGLPMVVQEMRKELENWFRAMEDGSVKGRKPRSDYRVPISAEFARRKMREIDEEFAAEMGWASLETAGGYTLGPGFSRLTDEQAIGLVQRLCDIRDKYPFSS